MRKIISLYSDTEFKEFLNHKGDESYEFIIGHKSFSRLWELNWDQASSLAKEVKEAGFPVFFQWDILMTESAFMGASQLFKQHDFSVFNGIRVQDAGALSFLKEINYSGDIHVICENGNHNTQGLRSWYDFWPTQIKRLVVSAEIPSVKLAGLRRELPCELEVLAAGHILLFYTPRLLVAPLYGEAEESEGERNKEDVYRVWGTSEESPHKGFPIIENQHGTFMFNTKELYILGESQAIENVLEVEGEDFIFRVDYPIETVQTSLKELLKNDHEAFQSSREMGQTKGFFRTNKTDVLFKKLKNSRLQNRGENYIGDVVDVKKKKHLGILIKSPDVTLKAGDELRLLSPEGREKFVTLAALTDADREEMPEASTGQIFFIPHVGGISVRTMVFGHRPLEGQHC